jgi:pantetheine-phosphate adenylyltransferase
MGHVDVIQRARLMFDKVVIAVLANPGKSPLFTTEERLQLIRETLGDDSGIEVVTFDGLTVDAAKEVGAVSIVRGLRAISDFESEFQMALMNRRLAPDIHTVFLMTSFSNVYISSTIIKEVCRLGGDIAGLTPPASAKALRAKFDNQSQ